VPRGVQSAGLGRNAESQRRCVEVWLELLLELLALCDGADAWLEDDDDDVPLDVCAYDGADDDDEPAYDEGLGGREGA
jgi:hypothetical protein